jgi:NADPH:quinone reductase-like Zn-dependent oxidoreductase
MTTPPRQTILLLQNFGGPEQFVLADSAVPEPAPGEVLVKILAASVQFTDVMLRKGRYASGNAWPTSRQPVATRSTVPWRRIE